MKEKPIFFIQYIFILQNIKRLIPSSQIWEVNHGSKLYAPLRLHQSWVTDIQFGKAIFIYVLGLKKELIKFFAFFKSGLR